MSALVRQILRIHLRWLERALDRPFTLEASARLDAALVAAEGRR